jgi:hypothetical protein
MVTQGLSERRALTVAHMSAATLRYVARPDPDPGLRERIVALAHRHRRYGAGMIYLKLRQEGRRVNHKRVDRLRVAIKSESALDHADLPNSEDLAGSSRERAARERGPRECLGPARGHGPDHPPPSELRRSRVSRAGHVLRPNFAAALASATC